MVSSPRLCPMTKTVWLPPQGLGCSWGWSVMEIVAVASVVNPLPSVTRRWTVRVAPASRPEARNKGLTPPVSKTPLSSRSHANESESLGRSGSVLAEPSRRRMPPWTAVYGPPASAVGGLTAEGTQRDSRCSTACTQRGFLVGPRRKLLRSERVGADFQKRSQEENAIVLSFRGRVGLRAYRGVPRGAQAGRRGDTDRGRASARGG